MPIKVQDELPAREALEAEKIFVITEKKALEQDIRPLEVAILIQYQLYSLQVRSILMSTNMINLFGKLAFKRPIL